MARRDRGLEAIEQIRKYADAISDSNADNIADPAYIQSVASKMESAMQSQGVVHRRPLRLRLAEIAFKRSISSYKELTIREAVALLKTANSPGVLWPAIDLVARDKGSLQYIRQFVWNAQGRDVYSRDDTPVTSVLCPVCKKAVMAFDLVRPYAVDMHEAIITRPGMNAAVIYNYYNCVFLHHDCHMAKGHSKDTLVNVLLMRARNGAIVRTLHWYETVTESHYSLRLEHTALVQAMESAWKRPLSELEAVGKLLLGENAGDKVLANHGHAFIALSDALTGGAALRVAQNGGLNWLSGMTEN